MTQQQEPEDKAALTELSEDHHAQVARELAQDPVAKRIARRIVNGGYILFAILSLVLFAPMILSIGRGVYEERAWDPHSGAPVVKVDDQTRCIDEAQRLISEAAKLPALKPSWDGPQSAWNERCRTNHPDLYELLLRTRAELHKRGKGKS